MRSSTRVTSNEDMGLDFVYGNVQDGVLQPLDGQQRLTTLFLLHWYVASLAGTLDPNAPWLRFSYATRPTARDFCRRRSPSTRTQARRPARRSGSPTSLGTSTRGVKTRPSPRCL